MGCGFNFQFIFQIRGGGPRGISALLIIIMFFHLLLEDVYLSEKTVINNHCGKFVIDRMGLTYFLRWKLSVGPTDGQINSLND